MKWKCPFEKTCTEKGYCSICEVWIKVHPKEKEYLNKLKEE